MALKEEWEQADNFLKLAASKSNISTLMKVVWLLEVWYTNALEEPYGDITEKAVNVVITELNEGSLQVEPSSYGYL